MSLEPFGEAFRRSSRFGGNFFVLVVFVLAAIVIAVAVISDVIHGH